MTFKPATWYPIAIALSAINLVGVGAAAAGPGPEPLHAALHATLALAFGLWAQRLRQARAWTQRQAEVETPEVFEALEGLGGEVARLRQEMSEIQERLDFTERVLAKGPRQENK
jgi:hypothetical protein